MNDTLSNHSVFLLKAVFEFNILNFPRKTYRKIKKQFDSLEVFSRYSTIMRNGQCLNPLQILIPRYRQELYKFFVHYQLV